MPKHTSKRGHAKRSRSRRSNKKTRRNNGRGKKVGGFERTYRFVLSGVENGKLEASDFKENFRSDRVKIVVNKGIRINKKAYTLYFIKATKEDNFNYYIFDARNMLSLGILKTRYETEVSEGINQLLGLGYNDKLKPTILYQKKMFSSLISITDTAEETAEETAKKTPENIVIVYKEPWKTDSGIQKILITLDSETRAFTKPKIIENPDANSDIRKIKESLNYKNNNT
jgi:hypothetical protein